MESSKEELYLDKNFRTNRKQIKKQILEIFKNLQTEKDSFYNLLYFFFELFKKFQDFLDPFDLMILFSG